MYHARLNIMNVIVVYFSIKQRSVSPEIPNEIYIPIYKLLIMVERIFCNFFLEQTSTLIQQL